MAKKLSIKDFQTTVDGNMTDLFFLENEQGLRAAITNYGARIVALWIPDRNGEIENIAAGYEHIDNYLVNDEIYLGATVGRFANRIGDASFSLNGERYRLTANEGRNHLHGGPGGFHQKVWTAQQRQPHVLELFCESKDGSDGYPGTLQIKVSYSLDKQDGLTIEYAAQSDKDTHLNMTNHTYFNLGGENRMVAARAHQIKIFSDYFLPVDEQLVPTGEIAEVDSTPFDFRQIRTINDGLSNAHLQLKPVGGYDHHFVLKKDMADGAYQKAAEVVEPISGRRMEVFTTEPGMQFFECRFSDNHNLNLDSAFCLETQHFPDSPNRPEFPSTVLKAGDSFHSKTTYRFDIVE